MDVESIFKTAGTVLAVFVFLILLWKVYSVSDVSGINQDALVKELSLTADAMMKNQGEFTTIYDIDMKKFDFKADDKYIFVKYGQYSTKYPYFKDKNHKIIFEEKTDGLLMKKVKM